MQVRRIVASLVGLFVFLSPVASQALDFTKQDILKAIHSGQFWGEGVTVEVSVTDEATPDYVLITASCEISGNSRQEVRSALKKTFLDIKEIVAQKQLGSRARVRRAGWWVTRVQEEEGVFFSGSMNLHVRLVGKATMYTEELNDAIEDAEDTDCTVTGWDVRLTKARVHERKVLPELLDLLRDEVTQLEEERGKPFGRVLAASITTWADPSAYEPEGNTLEATTTLSVTFQAESEEIVEPIPQVLE